MLLAVTLSAILLAASLAVVTRLRIESRSERIVACSIVASALQMAPFYVLGVTGLLRRSTVAMATILTCVGVIAVAARRPLDARSLASGAIRTGGELFRTPIDAITLLARERSPHLLAVLLCLGLFLWSGISAYLAPSWRGWDAIWYHETMIGFTLQNGGFAVVDMPMSGLQKVNGYPRLCEMTQAWFALFAGRRIIDLPNTLFLPALFAGSFLLVGRATANLSARLAWAAAVVLTPACVNLLQSVYVDPQTAAYTVAAAHFSTRPLFRLRHAALAATAVACIVGAKILGLVPAAVLSVFICVRLVALARRERRWRQAGLTFVLGGTLVVAIACTTYLRNLKNFHNPFWPDLNVKVPALGIDWPGRMPWGSDLKEQDGNRVEMNETFGRLLTHLYSLPYSIHRAHYGEVVDYGLGWIWVGLPLGLLGWAWSSLELLIAWLVARARGASAPDGDRPAFQGRGRTIGLLNLLLAIVLWTSPALWAARYQLTAVALLGVAAAWLAERLQSNQLAHAAPFAVAVGSIMLMWWATPRWWLTPQQLIRLARTPFPLRELDADQGAPVATRAGMARERYLTSGTTLVLHDFQYPALLWNNDYSNRVVFVENEPLASAAARLHATGVLCDSSCTSLAPAE